MTYKLDSFTSAQHGGYLLDSGFLVQCVLVLLTGNIAVSAYVPSFFAFFFPLCAIVD